MRRLLPPATMIAVSIVAAQNCSVEMQKRPTLNVQRLTSNEEALPH